MNADFESEEGLREYVEAELDRTVRAKHPELEVQFKEDYPTATPSPHLWWRITDPDAEWPTFYTVEVRRDDREFLVWYGHITAGEFQTLHAMRMAVHLAFRSSLDLPGAEDYPRMPEQMRGMGSLGSVLELMLAVRRRLPWPNFPMNCLALT